MIPPPSPQLLTSLVNQYQLNLGDKKVWCPYWMDNWKKSIRGPHGGKGTPSEITQTATQLAKQQDVSLQKLSPRQIRQFMTQNRLGIDCSGFIYYLLDQIHIQLRHQKNPPNPARFRCNANCLTNDTNTSSINFSQEKLQPGDLIRIHQGRHVAIIVQLSPSQITYAHSSSKTATTGVHYATINIIHPHKDLSHQHWQESTQIGANYATAYFNPQKGDGPRRSPLLNHKS